MPMHLEDGSLLGIAAMDNFMCTVFWLHNHQMINDVRVLEHLVVCGLSSLITRVLVYR